MTQLPATELFHIHLDAQWIDPRLSNALLDTRGFGEKNFIRDGSRGSEYSPHVHLTKKFADAVSFKRDFDFIMGEVEAGRGLDGYVEGEFIALNRQFEPRTRVGLPSAPFRVELSPLAAGTFRQTELHLTVSSEESDPATLATLFDMGFFCAYALKDYGRAQIFTMQGSYRNIAAITPMLTRFIEEGGLAHARLKEERIVRWWVSNASVALPPVVGKIEQLVPAMAQ